MQHTDSRQVLVTHLIEILAAQATDHVRLPPLNGLDYPQLRSLLRALMNLWQPAEIPAEFLQKQDALLQTEAQEKGVVTLADTTTAHDPRLHVWRGDITRLRIDAITNAANNTLLGCFSPNHSCIDNAIHSAAGLQLRQACHELVLRSPELQAYGETTGNARITPAFNLPADYVIHTVGPIVQGHLTPKHRADLIRSYQSVLSLAFEQGLHSVALCCISTGVFGFPPDAAATIAVATARDFLQTLPIDTDFHILFNVFTKEDHDRYHRLLFS